MVGCLPPLSLGLCTHIPNGILLGCSHSAWKHKSTLQFAYKTAVWQHCFRRKNLKYLLDIVVKHRHRHTDTCTYPLSHTLNTQHAHTCTHRHTHTPGTWKNLLLCIKIISNFRKENEGESQVIHLNHTEMAGVVNEICLKLLPSSCTCFLNAFSKDGSVHQWTQFTGSQVPIHTPDCTWKGG